MITPIHVACSRGDRLGARLRNCLHAMEFSKRIGASLTINWSPTARGIGEDSQAIYDEQHRFFDLFNEQLFRAGNPDISISSLKREDFKAMMIEKGYERLSEIGRHPISHFCGTKHTRIHYNTTHAYHFSNHHEACGAIAQLFAELPLHQGVTAALERVEKACPLADALCLHVRRGDIMQITQLSEDRRGLMTRYRQTQSRTFSIKYAPYEAYQKAITKLGLGKPIVVFSDDATIKHRFAADYPDDYLNYDAILDPLPLTPQQRDFVELLLISRCRELVGLRSAFVELPSLLGGRILHHVHGFTDAQTLIHDVGELIGNSEETRELYLFTLQGFRSRFAKSGFFTAMAEIDSHLKLIKEHDAAQRDAR